MDQPANYTRLVIRDLKLNVRIGVYEEEQVAAQPVLINLEADVIPPINWQADSYADVVCYDTLTKGIRAIAAQGHIQLVETLAEKIAQLALSTPMINAVTVRVEKTAIMPDASAVGIEIRRSHG